MGASDGNSVVRYLDDNVDKFMRIFNEAATKTANDKVIGGVELFLLDETFTP